MATKKHNPHGQFFVLLASMPGADKEDLVWRYSDMLTTSLSELLEKHPVKYDRMIDAMQRLVSQSAKPDDKARLIIDRELKKRRSAILFRLQKLGVDTTSWSVVNKFMSNPKIAGKTLGEMDTDEMDMLIPKLEAILAKDKANAIGKLTKAAFSQN